MVSEVMYREFMYFLQPYLICFLLLTNFQTLLVHLRMLLHKQVKILYLLYILDSERFKNFKSEQTFVPTSMDRQVSQNKLIFMNVDHPHIHYNYPEFELFRTSDIKLFVFLYLNAEYMPYIQNIKVIKFLVMQSRGKLMNLKSSC